MSNAIHSYRRYLLLKFQYHELVLDRELAAGFLSKHDATVGTDLPLSVPHRDLLREAHYTAIEDVFGADPEELVEQVGLTFDQAKAVIEAVTHIPFCEPSLVVGATASMLVTASPSSFPSFAVDAPGNAA